jgi:hypothetical protein
VKCFNQTGFGNMAEPRQSVMFVCGDDASANETVRQLAAEIGFNAIAIGTLDKARLLEPLAMLWTPNVVLPFGLAWKSYYGIIF